MERAVLSIYLVLLLVSAAGAESQPRITVTGDALVQVTPDKIIANFGIETQDLDAGISKDQNNEILSRAVAAFEDLGVESKDIQTDHLSIQPIWDDSRRRVEREFLGYRVRNRIAVILEETKKLESVVVAALKAGVNHLHGVEFQSTEFKKYREEARELAVKAAREKAEKMAAVLGASVGCPLDVQETGGGMSHSSSWSNWGGAHIMSQNTIAVHTQASEFTEGINLGDLGIRGSVRITFRLE